MLFTRQRIGSLLGWLLIAAVAILVYLQFHHPAPPPPRHGPDADFAPHVYLWQRAWTDSVKHAVTTEAASFARVVVLSRQIDFDKSPPHIVKVAVDWPALKATHTPIAAALRISTYAGPFDGPSAQLVAQTARNIIDEAAAAGVTLTELQIDFDAPTSKLSGYRTWLGQARSAAAPIPVTLTALPTWLDSPAFVPLAKDAGYFVLQVHWLDRPHRLTDPLVLCDIPTARRAIEKAARLNVPFRLALPTYGYVAAFNADGSFASMAAEGALPDWADGKITRLVEANPTDLVAFVNELAANRPMNLLGIIWYRLPIDTDRLNWSWTTLQSVMAGQVPRPGKLTVQCIKTADNLYDIQLKNVGQRDADTGVVIALDWPDAAFVAADALAGFQLLDHGAASLELLGARNWQSRLKPAEARTIAWLRLNKETTLHASIQPCPAPGPAADGTLPAQRGP